MRDGLRANGHEVDVIDFGEEPTGLDTLLRRSEGKDTTLILKGISIPVDTIRELAKQRDCTYFTPDSMSCGPRRAGNEMEVRAMHCQRAVLTSLDGCRALSEAGYSGRIAEIYQGFRPEVWLPQKNNVLTRANNTKTITFFGNYYNGDGGRRRKLQLIKSKGFSVSESNQIYLEEAAEQYRNSAINLNFICGEIISNRVIRILGAGGFALSEYCADLGHSYERGQELDWWTSDDEMLNKIHYYLSVPEHRAEIAAAGHKLAKKYTWEHQMNKITKFIQGNRVCDGAAYEYCS